MVGGDLRVGRASARITPPAGMPMHQGFVQGPDSIHDDRYAKAMVLEKDGVMAAMIVCDMALVKRAVVEQARILIEAFAGIPGDRVIISATHCHAGPAVYGSPETGQTPQAEIARQYFLWLPQKIAEAVVAASAKLMIALGDQVALVGLPGEIFVELGMAIKKASPFRHTIVAELANGSLTAYVPDRDAYPQGGYEVLNARGAPGSGELLVESAVRMLKKLHR